MRIPRIYIASPLEIGESIACNTAVSHRLSHVMRLSENYPLILFNGKGGEYSAHIQKISKRCVNVLIDQYQNISRESSIKIHLYQSIAHRDKMDWIVQKSTELGADAITPLITERCAVKFDSNAWQKKEEHFQKIIVSASEQCGRNQLLKLRKPLELSKYEPRESFDNIIVLDPLSLQSFSNFMRKTNMQKERSNALFVGPEGGFSNREKDILMQQKAIFLRFGRRILRMETAAIAAIAALQSYFDVYEF